MKKRDCPRFLAGILILALLAGLLTGCGPRPETPAPEASGETTRVTSEPELSLPAETELRESRPAATESTGETAGMPSEQPAETGTVSKETEAPASRPAEQPAETGQTEPAEQPTEKPAKPPETEPKSTETSPETEPEETVPPETAAKQEKTCTLWIRCDTVLDNLDQLAESKKDLVPEGGWILCTDVSFAEGDSVLAVLERACSEYGISLRHNGSYVSSIAGLGEFDCGAMSGWMVSVSGVFSGCSAAEVYPADGDRIDWRYTCSLGADIGGHF